MEHGAQPRLRKKGPRTQGFYLKKEDIERVVQFIKNYAEDHAIVLPGRHPGHRDFTAKLLPTNITKATVYRFYKDAVTKLGERVVSLDTFRRLWRSLLPQITSTKPRSDLCWQCQKNNYQVFRSANLPEEVKSAKLRKQEQHLDLVAQERAFYKEMTAACTKTCQDLDLSLGPSTPASKEIRMHYSFDFAQQVHFPSDPLQPGPMYFLTPRKCGIFGVACEGMPKQVNYLIDEGMSSSKGSSAVINYVDHFFNNYGVGEECVDLHCDNCTGQNKNNFVLWYCAWRTIHKLHLKLDLHFLIAGHTKFAPDWAFGLFKQCFRKTRVDTLSDIAEVVRKSTPDAEVNIPQLVGLEDGTVLVESHDWQDHLKPYFRPFIGLLSYQHFSFDAQRPGVVVARRHCDDAEPVEFQLLKNTDVQPPRDGLRVQAPPGLDMARQKYLNEKIREFVHEEAQDITCPPPNSTAAQNKTVHSTTAAQKKTVRLRT